MQTFCVTLRPQTAFGSPLLGETLFGQMCWAIRRLYGEGELNTLLSGYDEGRPFAVLSDAMPAGYVPLPSMPNYLWQDDDGSNRKYLKKKAWIPFSALAEDPFNWQTSAKSDEEVCPEGLRAEQINLHNTINRMTGTTGKGQFAPFMQPQTWLNTQVPLTVVAVIDESRFSVKQLIEVLTYIGISGFGRDASVGLGKFTLDGEVKELESQPPSTTHLTLASCALSGIEDLVPEKTFYRTKTHFGRHGDELALVGTPFKYPILLATAGAVITTNASQNQPFVGKGLKHISYAQPEAVHQGYSPVLPLLKVF